MRYKEMSIHRQTHYGHKVQLNHNLTCLLELTEGTVMVQQ
jgi:hypothetical protein